MAERVHAQIRIEITLLFEFRDRVGGPCQVSIQESLVAASVRQINSCECGNLAFRSKLTVSFFVSFVYGF